MGVGSGLCMYDVVVKRSRSLCYLLMSSCSYFANRQAEGKTSPLPIGGDISVVVNWESAFLPSLPFPSLPFPFPSLLQPLPFPFPLPIHPFLRFPFSYHFSGK